MRHTIRGLIIQNKKVLLVTGHGADFYWTPGGGIETDETAEQTLRREIGEELGVTIKTLTPYSSYDYEDQKVENYLIEIEGAIVPGSEITGTVWYSSALSLNTSNGLKDMVLPHLLTDGLIE